jgi:hypothetical protein
MIAECFTALCLPKIKCCPKLKVNDKVRILDLLKVGMSSVEFGQHGGKK